MLVSQFFLWLELQRSRGDAVGEYARLAVANVCYPRSSRLPVLLKHEPDASRDGLKRAHREWRRSLEQRHSHGLKAKAS